MSILNVNAGNYQKYTQAEKPALIEFSALRCVYCRRLTPTLETMKKK